MKKILNIAASLALAFFILSASVMLTLSIKATYALSRNDIVQVEYQLDDKTIKENYDGLIDYMFKSGNPKLTFKELPMSPEGEIHFKEVRDIFRFAWHGMLISGGISLILGIILCFMKNVSFLKYGSILVVLIPVLLAIPIARDFDTVFLKFHELAFSNNYWIFDPAKDPIIRYLPESLFMKNAVIILIFIVIFTGMALKLHNNLNKKFRRIG